MSAKRLPPGPRGKFLLGHVTDYFRGPLEFFERCAREHGDIVQVRMLPWQTTYLLFHPDHIEQVLRHDHRHFSKDRLTHQLSSILGKGLLTNEGEDWRKQRRLIQPGFQHEKVQQYAGIMVSLARRTAERWQPGERRDIHSDMMQLTLEIVAKALFDADVETDARAIAGSLNTILTFFENPVNWPRFRYWIPTPGLLRFRKAVKCIDEVIYSLIENRRREGFSKDDLLSLLLQAQDEEGSTMSDQQLRDELITLLLAGHETTALALSYSFYLISQHPDVEGKLREEIREVLGDRPATMEDIARLTYAEQVIKESMRLYPPAWTLGREALEECEIGGFTFPKGAQFDLPQWIVHRDPRWHVQADQFIPERWGDERTADLPRCAYYPFGDGPRVCVGNYFAMIEATLALVTLLQNHSLKLVMDKPLQLVPSVTLRPRDGILMEICSVDKSP